MMESDQFLEELFREEMLFALGSYRRQFPFSMQGCATMFLYGFSDFHQVPAHVMRTRDLLAMRNMQQ